MEPKQLKQCNGKDGRPAYFAYKGNVYDASTSRMWRNGVHARIHHAGEDLTEAMRGAPHGDEVLERLQWVDLLRQPESQHSTVSDTGNRREKLAALYHRYHPHPVLVHFPIALKFFAAFMLFMFLVARDPSYEASSYYAIMGGTLFSLPAIAAGIVSWWVNYDMKWNVTFTVKFWGSMVLIVTGLAAVAMRMALPEVAYHADALAWLYHFLFFVQVPVVFVVAYYGGKLSWPG